MRQVTTLTGSVYIIDGEQVIRYPGVESNELRKDGDKVTITVQPVMEIGKPMIFLLTRVSDDPGVYTIRTTSPVVQIDELNNGVELAESLRGGGHSIEGGVS